jgi:hypothetical protein
MRSALPKSLSPSMAAFYFRKRRPTDRIFRWMLSPKIDSTRLEMKIVLIISKMGLTLFDNSGKIQTIKSSTVKPVNAYPIARLIVLNLSYKSTSSQLFIFLKRNHFPSLIIFAFMEFQTRFDSRGMRSLTSRSPLSIIGAGQWRARHLSVSPEEVAIGVMLSCRPCS